MLFGGQLGERRNEQGGLKSAEMVIINVKLQDISPKSAEMVISDVKPRNISPKEI